MDQGVISTFKSYDLRNIFCKPIATKDSYSSDGFAAAAVIVSSVRLCVTIDGSHQAPLSLRFSRQEHWSGLPLPSPMHVSEK